MAVEIANVLNCMAMCQVRSEDDFRMICEEGVSDFIRTGVGTFVLVPENTLDYRVDDVDDTKILRYNTVPTSYSYLGDQYRVVVGGIPQNSDQFPGCVAIGTQQLNEDDVWVNVDLGLFLIQCWQFPTQQ